jgi:putative intracellular protease/amidase
MNNPNVATSRYFATCLLLAAALAAIVPLSPVWAQSGERALVVVTSRDFMTTRSRPTGYRLVEVIHAWDVFRRAGMLVDIASGRGGKVPADSTGYAPEDSAAQRVDADQDFRRALTKTKSIALLKPEEYSVVLFIGGHGALWEFLEDPVFAKVAGAVHDRGGILATIGHGAAVLLTTKTPAGASILPGTRLTCTSDEEERKDGFAVDIPYFLESALRRGGAIHYRDAVHTVNVVAEDRVITGQNSESARETVNSVVLKLTLMRAAEKSAKDTPAINSPGGTDTKKAQGK